MLWYDDDREECNLNLAMAFRRWWLLGYSGRPISTFDLLSVCVLLNFSSEHPNIFVLAAGIYLFTQIVHKSVHAYCAQPHVKLVSI